jgi:hypothetical protein
MERFLHWSWNEPSEPSMNRRKTLFTLNSKQGRRGISIVEVIVVIAITLAMTAIIGGGVFTQFRNDQLELISRR